MYPDALRFPVCAAPTIKQGAIGIEQDLRRFLDCRIIGRFCPAFTVPADWGFQPVIPDHRF
jgi:hypothetical protein